MRSCGRWAVVTVIVLATALVVPSESPAQDGAGAAYPPSNDPRRTDEAPRPEASTFEGRARALFDAIRLDDPALAREVFFPRDAFVLVKAIANPGRYWDRLAARFERDIHTLHRADRDIARAEFDRFELVHRGGWVPSGGEGNRAPYWAARHNWLHYKVDGRPRRFEVRVLITWADEWYVIHLNEFR